jgi:hypothetical protein
VLVSAYEADIRRPSATPSLPMDLRTGSKALPRSGSSRPSALLATSAPTTSRPTHRSIPGTPEANSSTRTATSSASRARRSREAGSGSPSTSETYAPRCSRGTAAADQPCKISPEGVGAAGCAVPRSDDRSHAQRRA